MFIDVKLKEKIANGFTRLAAIDIVESFRFLINSLVPQRDLSKEEWKSITTAVMDEMYFPTSDEDRMKMEEEFKQDLIDRMSSSYGKTDEGGEDGSGDGSTTEPETEEAPKYTTIMEAISGSSSSTSPEGGGDATGEDNG